MDRFTTLSAPAAPLALDNVDTDQIIPARFMKRSRAEGYGPVLLHDLRFDEAGAPRPDFVLNTPRHAGAKVLVGGRNFGSGSSREAAVYALWDYGIRCVIAPSFGDIFASNAVKNGLLPARVSEEDAATLLAWLDSANDTQLQVDLEACTITAGGQTIPFSIDPVRRTQLLNGWDDIDLTRERAAAIASFRTARAQAEPWAIAPPAA
ncbi:MAG: 3-isopropylmalate dehydratase small subunit [Alphaproteobacteria bacterium]|nr:3-isopropylmalate dehydratase small subunit [Alphaproteobacteria bacterium]